MTRSELINLYDKELREQVEYPEAKKEITRDVVRFKREAPGMSFVSLTYAQEADLERVIQNEVAHFKPAQGHPFTWKVYDHDPLPSLGEKLAAHGFEKDEDRGDVMIFDVTGAHQEKFETNGLDIRQITSREGLKDVVSVLDKVWGNSNEWVYDRLGRHLDIPGYLSIYAGYADDKPVSIAWTYFPRGQFATLFAGSTLPEHRKRGFYTGILWKRLKEIRNRGARYAVVEAGDMSRPIVEKHGFRLLTTVWDYVWKGSRW